MKGGAAAPAVAPEVFPVLTLENDRPEWGWLKDEALRSRAVDVGGAAGVNSMVQIYLPSTAQSLCVVEEIHARSTASVNVVHLVGIGGGTVGWSAITNGTRDFRSFSPQSDAALLETRQGALPTFHAVLAQLATSAQPSFRNPIVISPGQALCMYALAVNTALSINLSWRTRPALPGELV
jgi:hypothetical protein